VADFKLLHNLCVRFYAFRLCLWQIFYASIVFLAGLVCQGYFVAFAQTSRVFQEMLNCIY